MEVTLEERVAALERKLSASEAEEEPAGYYTSKYSGEEIDALLDKSAGGGTSPRRNILTTGISWVVGRQIISPLTRGAKQITMALDQYLIDGDYLEAGQRP